MTRFLNRNKKVFRSIAGVLIYCMVLFPILTSVGAGAMKPAGENVELSKKEKEELVKLGVTQFQKGEREQARKTLEHAREVFAANYAVPYYLGLIYLEEGRRSDAIDEWKQYVLMDPKSEDSLKIRKYLTLLLREEAVKSAKQAIADEAALLQGSTDDNTVTVTTFKNLGSKDLGPLGKGMAVMLIHDLSQVPDLHVVEWMKLQALLQEMKLGRSGLVDPKTAPKVGKLLKSKHVTTGSLTDLEKENLQIVSVVFDAEQMESIGTQEAQGALKKFYDLEKNIACSIVEDLGRDCKNMPKAFRKIHTKSLAALIAFSIGLDYFDQEKYDEARKEFQKAIDEDPKFDLARETLERTPRSAMLEMNTSDMTSTLSNSAASSSTFSAKAAPYAVAGGGGGGVGVIGTAAILLGAGGIGAIAAGGGGGGDGALPPPASSPSVPNLTGVWVGTWNDTGGPNNGSISSLNLTQTNTSVDGTIAITGSTCIITGSPLTGNVSGNSLTAQIVSGSSTTVSLNANFTSTSMNGTLAITSTLEACNGLTWNFSASITGGAIINW